MNVGFLLVTCCLEETRHQILQSVIKNLKTEAPEIFAHLVVFDNSSSHPETLDLLSKSFLNVYVSERNVGYWTAIDWWLSQQTCEFTYIIESDMMHWNFERFWIAKKFLESRSHVGSVRLHEYDVKNKHLYNKDIPARDSRRTVWQSHTNKITGRPVEIQPESFDGIYETNFLTQLPALNRCDTMKRVFNNLREKDKFTELDFQREYHQEYQVTGIVDGGIFNSDLGSKDAGTITGSWGNGDVLLRLGYHTTRTASITRPERYKVNKVC